MKRILTLALALALVLSLAACGSGKTADAENSDNASANISETKPVEDDALSEFYGTWDVESAKFEETVYTVAELEAMGDYSMSDFYIVIKKGGTAYVYGEGEGSLVDWSGTPDGIELGIREVTLVDGKLCLNLDNGFIFYEKTSDSQTITDRSTEESSSNPEDSGSTAGVGTDFKDAMDSYEAFFDEYCAFMKKYQDSSDTTSMLTDYMKYMTQYAETMEKLDAIEDDLSGDELKYYVEVMGRISQKLLDVVS